MPVTAGTAPATAANEAYRTRTWMLGALTCLVVAFWIIIHPLRGVEHDSVLYAVLALARLHPSALGHDLFVRFGTQDKYTVFSPLFAAAVRAMGLNAAAALITFINHAAFFAAAWLFARRLMSARNALLAVGLLVSLPSWYGANTVFSSIETFPTPRQAAEAFALGGIVAALYSRQILAGLCMLGAMLLHPIIAAAGIILWVTVTLGFSRPWLSVSVAAGIAITVVILSLAGIGPFVHFDQAWLSMLQERLVYLFPTEWPKADWINTCIRIAVLVVGTLVCRNTVRRLCIAGLITTAIGMLFTVIECDLLHVALAGQLQTWRWLWLTGTLAVLLAPPILIDCWRAGDLGRTAAVLLVTAWATQFSDFSIAPTVLACLCALAVAWMPDAQHTRSVYVGSWVIAAIGLVLIADECRQLPSLAEVMRAERRPYLGRIGVLQTLTFEGLLPAAILGLCAWTADRVTRRTAVLIAVLCAALLLSVLPYAQDSWTQAKFPEERYQAFAPWRAAIPESAEVLWPDPPPAAWFELGRASYWSLYQMAGMVFSRDVSMLGDHREQAVTPVLPTLGRTLSGGMHYAGAPHQNGERPAGPSPCTIPDVTFYASWVDLGPTPWPPVAPDARHPHDVLYLYRCDGRS